MKYSFKKSRGNAEILLILAVVICAMVLSGIWKPSQEPEFGVVPALVGSTNQLQMVAPSLSANKTVQMSTFSFITKVPTITLTPTGASFILPTDPPVTTPPGIIGNNCNTLVSQKFMHEPIIAAFDPGAGKTVSSNGKIRVWIADELAPFIAPHEQVDPNTGTITPGDRTALDGVASNYYLWEPAIYLTQITSSNTNGPYSGDAENGGKPYFPSIIKGDYNASDEGTADVSSTSRVFARSPRIGHGPAIDSDYRNFENGSYGPIFKLPDSSFNARYAAEYIWDVSSFGLPSGTYHAEFVIHDGDVENGLDCVTIQI